MNHLTALFPSYQIFHFWKMKKKTNKNRWLFSKKPLAPPVRLGTPPTGHPGLTNVMAGTTIPRDIAPVAPAALATATASESVALGGESVTTSLSLAGAVGETWNQTLKLGMIFLLKKKITSYFLQWSFSEGKGGVDSVEKCEGGCFFWGRVILEMIKSAHGGSHGISMVDSARHFWSHGYLDVFFGLNRYLPQIRMWPWKA